MPRNWMPTPLGKVVSLQRGFDLAKEARIPGPFRILSAGKSGETHNEAKVKGPGFAIGRATNLGKPQWSDEDFWPLNTTLFATDFHGNDPRWLFYWFENADLTGFDSGSVQPMLNRNYIAGISINLPPIEEQTAIATMLRSLDDKITANVRVLATANELVKNLYTAIPKSSNHAIESIGELVKKNVKPEEMDESKALINLEHFDSKQVWISRHAQVPEATSAKSSFLVGDVLFGKLRPYFHKVGVAPIGGYCSTDVLVVRPREDSYRGLLLAAMSAEETVAIATQNSNGTRMPRAKWADIASCAIPDPDDPKSIELGKLMDVLIPKCNALIHENHVLARTRDELLPLLMSGRITVGEAEKAANVADTAASES